ncbi:hypothetical protein L1987_60916 [Smallanthus sonchifolius]|uniref:Uncharacterized protein n=1 Tax=Smallanthus sonchifolius TaxID=185202 RepID=A0ACB9D9Q6_9ASTR|nr:hypothetical protein L1987_60916 [Smallanthus sonchifolius]
MAGGSGTLEQTPTWAVATVAFWLKKKRKRALYESLEKIKAELMLLGFISLLLTAGTSPITRICIPKGAAATWHPCSRKEEGEEGEEGGGESRRRLLTLSHMADSARRILAGSSGEEKCEREGKVSFMSYDGVHQLHILIFALALFHVIYSVFTMVLGQAKVCFFRQFFRSVPKVDYLTLRHGFIMLVLLIGTKLQVIIMKMGLTIQERGEVVQGVPVVQPGDDLFWFNRPRLILHLLNFVLFQNAFQVAFFAWTWYEFGLDSCFHDDKEDIAISITTGEVVVQILCSYVTLPLYALVTQMGSTMKPTVFNDTVATALRSWHQTARKQIKRNKKSGQVSPMSSRPGTPSHGMSPVHLLRNYKNDNDSLQTSPRMSNFDTDNWDTDGSPSPSYHQSRDTEMSTSYHHRIELGSMDQSNENTDPGSSQAMVVVPEHEVTIQVPKEFSFDKRPRI